MLDALFARLNLPWWIPSGVVKKVLDALLPNALLDAFEESLGI